MNGGYFVRTYELWRATTTTNDYGEEIQTWNKLADVPGRAYVGRAMQDTFAGGAEVGIIRWTFACPADTDINDNDQLRFDGRKLDIKAISVTSRGDRLQCLCQENQ